MAVGLPYGQAGTISAGRSVVVLSVLNFFFAPGLEHTMCDRPIKFLYPTFILFLGDRML